MEFDPNAELEMPCGNAECTQTLVKTLGELKENPRVTCPVCGSVVDATEFNSGMDKASKDLDDLLLGLGGLLR